MTAIIEILVRIRDLNQAQIAVNQDLSKQKAESRNLDERHTMHTIERAVL